MTVSLNGLFNPILKDSNLFSRLHYIYHTFLRNLNFPYITNGTNHILFKKNSYLIELDEIRQYFFDLRITVITSMRRNFKYISTAEP